MVSQPDARVNQGTPTTRPGGVLALDLSQITGWAYGLMGDKAPIFGRYILKKILTEGGRYAGFQQVLAKEIARLQPAKLLLEMALPLQAQTQMRVTEQQLTLRGIAHMEAHYAGLLPPSEIDVKTVRYDVLGRSHFPKGEVKKAVFQYCRGRGWDVPDHNAADACVLWEWLNGRLRNAGSHGGNMEWTR